MNRVAMIMLFYNEPTGSDGELYPLFVSREELEVICKALEIAAEQERVETGDVSTYDLIVKIRDNQKMIDSLIHARKALQNTWNHILLKTV